MEEEANVVVSKEKDRSTPTNLAKQDSGLLIIGDELESGKSLQDSFLKFRSQKIKERQIMKMCQQVGANGSRSEAFKDALRTKFIDAAKRYLGVPYALRFKAETDEVAPLYLDCCALVRQAVQDLQEDFGFVIGRWNQAYQMDTLPIVLKQEELRPGDLIFYEGVYNSNRSKPQKHNNVHVEIFLGGETGEETIGSRYHRGKVSIFPSFKFKSTTWDLVQYHFRSLDTWLDGNCRSCCPEHPWHNDSLNYLEAAGKRSIFSTDHEDESAGGEEEEDAPEQGGGSDSHTDGANNGNNNNVEEIVVNGGEEDETHEDPDDNEEIIIPVPAELADTPDTAAAAASAPELPSANVLDSICPLDNLPKPVQNQSTKDPSKPRRKSATEVAALIEETSKAAEKKPKRSSSINRSTDVSAGAEPASLSIKKASVVSKSLDLSSKSAKVSSKDIPKVYYVGKSNGWKLVKAAMDKRGWQQLPFEYQFSTRFGLKWVERRSDIDYRNHVPGQLVCHIPNNDCITTKIGILTVLRDKFCKSPSGTSSSTAVKIHPPWVPETYDLDIPADVSALMQAATDLNTKNTTAATADGAALDPEKITSGIWIYKPSCYNRGRGIRVVTGLDSLKEICYGKQTDCAETTVAPLKGIVQKYIENPLLISPGYKFDIRCYMLIARNHPSTLAFYHPGYCRLALKTYDISSVSSLADTSVHLTNASVQKKDPIYEANKELQIQSIAAVADTIEQGGAPSSADYLRNKLDHEIKLCMVDVLKASNHKFIKKHGYFDLLGCDFMLSSDNKLHLLEINTNPALSLDNSTLENLLPGVVDGAIELVLGSQGPDVKGTSGDAALLANIPQRFQLLFNEEKDYYYK